MQISVFKWQELSILMMDDTMAIIVSFHFQIQIQIHF
jgi:hypothetical protein